jgi:hypothetical protein
MLPPDYVNTAKAIAERQVVPAGCMPAAAQSSNNREIQKFPSAPATL